MVAVAAEPHRILQTEKRAERETENAIGGVDVTLAHRADDDAHRTVAPPSTAST
jgi:hypothetical protein